MLYSLWSTTTHQTPVNGANIDARCRVALRGREAAGSTMSCSRQTVEAIAFKGIGYSFKLSSLVIGVMGMGAATPVNQAAYALSRRPAAEQLTSNKPTDTLSQPAMNGLVSDGVVSETENLSVLQLNNWILNRFHAPIPLGGNA